MIGINVAGGNDSSSVNGRPGQNSFNSSSSSNQILTINGGEIYVDAVGDGLDANGSIYITGGQIYVDGPTNDGNGALDYDGVCNVTGGMLIAVGSSGMMQSASNSSTQNTISIVYSTTQTAKTVVTIKNSNNEEIIEYTPSKNFASIVISSSELKTGETYTAYSDETKISEFSVSGILTTIGNSNNGIRNNGGMRTANE